MCTTLLHCPPRAQEIIPRIAPVTRIGVESCSTPVPQSPESRGNTGPWSEVERVEESGGLSQPRMPPGGAAAAMRSHDVPCARRRRRRTCRPAAAATACSATSPRGGAGPSGREARGDADPRLRSDGGSRLTAPGRRPERETPRGARDTAGTGGVSRHPRRLAADAASRDPSVRPPTRRLAAGAAPRPGHTKRGRSRRTDPVEECGEPASSGRSACPSGRSSGP